MLRRFPPTRFTPSLLALAALCLLATGAAAARQNNEAAQPVFHDFKGVTIGMTADEARQKLGTPTDKSDMLDLYEVPDKQTIQIFYEGGKVAAIAIVYTKPGADVLTPKAVVGTDIEAKPDGSMHKMVRYPKAGYWVSYSRTGGSEPIVTVTMRKL